MSYLLKPLQIHNLKLKNRLIMPPIATWKAGKDGSITEDILNYYDEKSKGGYISLIIVEHSFVSKEGKSAERQLSICDDNTIEGLKRLADIIHSNDSKAIMQINHVGSVANKEITGYKSVGPSAIAHPRKDNIPKELTISEIQNIVENFKDAAIRVKKAGFDGVEIHAAHGFLLSQFFSPLTNKRTDEYGGDVLNRIKIHMEIIKAVREAVGNDFTVLLRLGAADYIDGGVTIDDSKVAAQQFEKAGVNILDISGGFCGYTPPNSHEEGYFASLTKGIKDAVSIPVILTGGITNPLTAEQLLAEGKADLIGVGRSIMNDSSWAKNAVEYLKG